MIALDTIDQDVFTPFIGNTFSVTTTSGVVPLRLSTVEKLGHRRQNASRDPFSLRFLGAPGLLLHQGIYLFSCDGFGEFEIFITQIAGGARDSEFEAVFT